MEDEREMAFYCNLERFGEKQAAIQEDGKEVTYTELSNIQKALQEVLPSRALIFTLCRNTLGSFCAYVGSLGAGVVQLLLDAEMPEELLNNLIETYRPNYLFVPVDHANFKKSTAVYITNEYKLVECYAKDIVDLNPELALLLTTSGSTGSPKLVRQSYKNIQANVESIVEYLELDETERPITTLPMNYTYGLSIINSHLQVGATMLLTTKTVLNKQFWDFAKAYSVTSFGGVPYTYEMLKKIKFNRIEIPTLRTMTQAGGKLSPELHKEFAEYALATGRHFVVMYGQTEATARMAYLPHDKALEKYGSMGIAIPGGKLQLLNERNEVITEPDVMGELTYLGDNVTLGYAEVREDLSIGDERQGCLITGDMAKMDKDGYFYIVGRKKRFLKLYGNRVNLDDLDAMIKRKYQDLDMASTGDDTCLHVYITDDTLLGKVKEYIHSETGINLKAISLHYIDKIPRNESGKILYKELY